MNKKVWTSLLVIGLAVLAISGGTWAWFTSQTEVENSFTAGTVSIEAEETAVRMDGFEVCYLENVNPGDCYEKELKIKNTGTKGIVLRMQLVNEWILDSDWENHISSNWDKLLPGFADAFESYTWIEFADRSIAPNTPERWSEFKEYVESLADGITNLQVYAKFTDPVRYQWSHYDQWYYQSDKYQAIGGNNSIDVFIEVCFGGESMTNEFQLAKYNLSAVIEAIQASNNASGSAWGVDSVYNSSYGSMTSGDWNDWGAPKND